MSTTDLHAQSLRELSAALRQRRISATELAQHFLARIRQHQALGAFLAVDEALTLAQARAADERLGQGDAGPLTGLPLAHKDIFVTQGWPSTAASKMLAGYRSPFDATVVQKLTDAGAVTLGKLSCDEFAMGSGNENAAIAAIGQAQAAPCRNPWDASRV
ncbi:MAG: amidase family protein, partial [Comamonadaceae bacterium]|nr:amidase family protein [Comamonadaceae bacterium]